MGPNDGKKKKLNMRKDIESLSAEQRIQDIEETYESLISDLEEDNRELQRQLESTSTNLQDTVDSFNDLYKQYTEAIELLRDLKKKGIEIMKEVIMLLYVKEEYDGVFGKEWMPVVINYVVDGDITFEDTPYINIPNDMGLKLIHDEISHIHTDDYFFCKAIIVGDRIEPVIPNPYWNKDNPPMFYVADLLEQLENDDEEDDSYEMEE